MIEHSEIFQLLAEMAIAVAGFAGVATVFGGQDRSFSTAEILRLRALFQFSALIIFCCLGLIAMDASGMSRELSVLYISIAAVLTTIWCALDVPLKATKLRGDLDSSITPLSLLIGFSPSVICVPLLSINALLLRQEWLLITVFSYYILLTLWSFYRLLVNRS
jgi:hypothetical protein